MKPPRRRTELLLAAAALLLAAGVLLAAGLKSALSPAESKEPQSGAAGGKPFEAAQPEPTDESPAEGSTAADASYVIGYTGVVVFPPVEAPLQPYDGETAPPQPQQTHPQVTNPPQAPVQPAYPVNLNTATQAQLETLPGIGPVKAQAILAWRAANGGFANANQLLQVSGIGQATLEGLLPYITW